MAVKQFCADSLQKDVLNEAAFLSSLCHPNLLFCVCISTKPHRLVMQFHGVGDKTVTFSGELCRQNDAIIANEWLVLCHQLVDAIDYLHRHASITHNRAVAIGTAATAMAVSVFGLTS